MSYLKFDFMFLKYCVLENLRYRKANRLTDDCH